MATTISTAKQWPSRSATVSSGTRLSLQGGQQCPPFLLVHRRLVRKSRLKRQTITSERQRSPAGRAIDRDRSVGDSPTFIRCCCKGGRVALPPLPSSLSGHDPFLLPHAQGFELLSRLLAPAAVRGGTRRARMQNTPDLHVDIFQGHLRTAFRERADTDHPLGLQRRN